MKKKSLKKVLKKKQKKKYLIKKQIQKKIINKIKGLKLNRLNPFYITFTIINIYCPKRGSGIHQTIIL